MSHSNCLICDSKLEQFISFGDMPIANGFLSPEEYDKEYFYELKVGFCSNCTMVQLMELVDENKMFHENYAFFSSTSVFMARHFKEFYEDVVENYIPDQADAFVIEIGSNDGIMLQNFQANGINHLGLEPSKNVAKVAQDKGINTITEFFTEDLAKSILAEYGKVDAFMGANVMCHIPYLHSVMNGVKLLLKDKGVLVFEDPYLGEIIEKISYDQIYDEHAFYFSLSSVQYLANAHELEVIDAIPQNVHGGSMRYVIGHKGAHEISQSVERIREREKSLGLDHINTYNTLAKGIQKSKKELLSLLQDLNAQGKKVVGYGATSKSTTVTNFCGITSELVEFISDTTPTKQNKYSPGTHIPVKPYDEFAGNYPDYALLFAWNHKEEIMAKEAEFKSAQGKWIVYVPKVEII